MEAAGGRGEPCRARQEQLSLTGHAIEARIAAEDPDRGFLPAIGRLDYYATPPQSAAVRIDSGVAHGSTITPYYDSLLAKLIVWGEDRDRALLRLRAALADFHLVGVANNVDFLGRLVASPAFTTAQLDTGLIEREHATLFSGRGTAAAASVAYRSRRDRAARELWSAVEPLGLSGRLAPGAPGAASAGVPLRRCGQDSRRPVSSCRLAADAGRSHQRRQRQLADGVDPVPHPGRCAVPKWRFTHSAGAEYVFWQRANPCAAVGESDGPVPAVDEGAAQGLRAPMPGRILELIAAPGAIVRKGAPLLVLEAMKIEHTILAPAAGTLTGFHVAAGEQVAEGAELVSFEPTPAAKE